MANITGLITINGKQVLEVDADPGAALGTAAPLGSLAMYDSGTVGNLYVKTSSADTGWQRVDVSAGQDWQIDGNELTGVSPSTPTEFFGSTNNYDLTFKRNNTELMRLVSDGLLVGLNASLGGRLQVQASALGADILKQISPNGGSGSQVVHVTRQYKVQTTNDSSTTLADIAIPSDAVANIEAKIVCRQHGGTAGSAGDGASYIRHIHARNISGAISVRQNATSVTSEDVNSFNVSVSASDPNVRIEAVGGVDRNIAWFAHVEMLLAVN
jgi:hypothetical protein